MPEATRKDRLASQAAETQRRKGELPDSRAIDSVFSETLERIDRKKEVRGSILKQRRDRGDRSTPRTPPAAEKELAKRGSRVLSPQEASSYEKRRPDPTPRDVLSKRAWRRIRLLKYKPDWRKKMLDAWDEGARIAFRQGYSSKGMRHIQDLKVIEVLDQSSAVFGEWRKEPKKRLTASGTGGNQTSSGIILP